MSRIVIKNARILTMATEAPQILEGDIGIEGSCIREIGRIDAKMVGDDAVTVIDAAGKVVMPGLINCHNHAAMALFRGYSDDLRLMEWLSQKIWPAEERLDGDAVYAGTMLAAAEMIKSGTTTFADMYFFMDDVARAVRDAGMRATLCQGLLFIDNQAERRLEATRRLFADWHGKAEGRIKAMVGPHAPYTCPPDKLQAVMALAKELQAAIHIHLSETVEEVDQMFDRYGKSPVRYLADLGLFAEHHVLLAHAVNLSRDDIHLLKGLRGGVSHNPVSNLKLGCGVAPVLELRDKGVAVALGTDGAGSATTLDLFEEIKAAAWLQKNRTGDPTAVTAYQALRMATIEGARALGLADRIGSIEPGKQADLILIDMNKPHLFPQNDICALLAYAANGADVDTVLIDGKVVMQNRQLLTMHEADVLAEAAAAARRVIRD
ncbi:amidohydrolase family protein [Heliobacterium undosum]|uniref:5-methylthioadenosine/S-adenosylhomocysteine deaminase n=1 Tax=Heliomicrobium undosum TaxID=121734 RepID=A0A845LBK3_9FIRM|nr:amidohydrolase [Heliomicrobium undosum]MZP31058.1 amidohydrolase family protein [Heliomicrobium undosum]